MFSRASKAVQEELIATLARVRGRRAELRADAELGPRWLAVKAWQSERFAQTYADLLASARYREPCQFFLDELYGTRDFHQRDSELGRVVPRLAGMLPDRAIETFLLAVQLDEMSERFDAELAHEVELPIDARRYAAAYPHVASQRERERQIEIVDRIGHALDRLARVPMLGHLLGMMKAPAESWGFAQLHHFLHRGFTAFAAMRGAGEFLAIIQRRERELNRRLFAGEADPFRPMEGR